MRVLVATGLIAAVVAVPDEYEEPTVRVERPPQRVENKIKVKPEAHPTPSEVREIANFEQRRWGGPSILGRIACESGYRWHATNGQYRGLLQVGSIWGYLWSGTPRGIREVSKRRVKKPIYRYTTHPDGTVEREKIGKVRQKRVRIRHGKLPRGADPYHGHAAIRVGQRAVAGYRTTGWSCGL